MADTTVQDILLVEMKEHRSLLIDIKEQVVKTNGRVTAHDDIIKDLKSKTHDPSTCITRNDVNWLKRSYWIAVSGAITIFTGIVILLIRILIDTQPIVAGIH